VYFHPARFHRLAAAARLSDTWSQVEQSPHQTVCSVVMYPLVTDMLAPIAVVVMRRF
jgi:hypothetical protein